MGQSTPVIKAVPQVQKRAPRYAVGQDREGHWIVRDLSGHGGGIFADKREALRFACYEADHHLNAVTLLPPHIRLSLWGPVPNL